MSEDGAIVSYRAFWPFYLRQHAKRQTRRWHIAGTGAAAVLLAAAAAVRSPTLFGAAMIAGYGPAWLAHLLVEKNHPATWRFPLWSLISDVRMAACWLRGTLSDELREAGVQPPF